MNSTRIAIVCEGKEIPYGTNLAHLFKLITDQECIKSNLGEKIDVDIYSLGAFKHSNTPKDTLKIYIGSAEPVKSTCTEIFSQYGISIYKTKENNYILVADDKRTDAKEYADFLSFANNIGREYCKKEKSYISAVDNINPNWIIRDFKASTIGGLFKKNATKLKQLYDCASYVMYLKFLAN